MAKKSQSTSKTKESRKGASSTRRSAQKPVETSTNPKLIDVRLGDVVSIRLKAKEYVFAKVVFLSKKTPGLLAMRVFDGTYPSKELPGSMPKAFVKRTYWTGSQSIKNSRWPVVGNFPVTEIDKDSTVYAVIGAVVQGETRIRKASDEDLEKLPGQVISPNNFVETRLKKAFFS